NKELVRLLAPAEKHERRENQMQQMQDMMSMLMGENNREEDHEEDVSADVRNKRMDVAEKLAKGLLEDHEVTIEVEQAPKANPMSDMMGQMGMDMGSMLSDLMPKKKVKRTLSVKEAREVLIQEESRKLVDYDAIYQHAIERSQNNGIIFIDEIDKIIAGNKRNSGEVSREGVQRDILPIVEGSTVNTKYGPVSTDHILFIAAGAFAESKPSDLNTALQGPIAFPVELNSFTKVEFDNILMDPQN
ncbi:AAA family ATPase, partial [Lactobacillus crispatus]|uniref:AAA family ATPase n=1 Tax=Lactobacillus crispatus TaxID=47770 RepID=UPI001F09C381